MQNLNYYQLSEEDSTLQQRRSVLIDKIVINKKQETIDQLRQHV